MEAGKNTAKTTVLRTQAPTKYTKTKESKVQGRNMQSCNVTNQVQSLWRYEKKQFKEWNTQYIVQLGQEIAENKF
jgi:hypothetical protein